MLPNLDPTNSAAGPQPEPISSQWNRRKFLASGMASLAALSLPLNVTASAAGDKERVRVAVVGSGGRGSDLIRKLTTISSVEIVAICDIYPPHLERGLEFAGGAAKGFADYEKMLKEVKPSAVVIATPLYLHFEMAMLALEKDCAVFCEKTMCYCMEQATQLREEVRRRNAVFQVGLQRRCNAIYRQAMAMVETGMLGRVTAIKSQWHRNNNWRRPVPVPRDHPDWKRLERQLNWRLYWDFSQGLMAELGSHQMDVANWALGRAPSRVMTSAGIDYWRDGREVFDNVFCIYDYELPLPETGEEPGGNVESENPSSSKENSYTVRVTYSSLQTNAFEGASELIMGTKGTLLLTQQKGLFYREDGPLDPGWSQDGRVSQDAEVITSGKTLKMVNDPWAHRGKPYEMDSTADDTRSELVEFINCVKDQNPATPCNVDVGFEDTATVIMANRAAREGRAVENEWI